MKIKFKDINTGIVQARAIIEIKQGLYINEVTILKKYGKIEVEIPHKSFKGKDGNIHNIPIITFESSDKKRLWKLEIKNEYKNWRKKNPKIEVYEKD